jgi:hypothetical protein
LSVPEPAVTIAKLVEADMLAESGNGWLSGMT